MEGYKACTIKKTKKKKEIEILILITIPCRDNVPVFLFKIHKKYFPQGMVNAYTDFLNMFVKYIYALQFS